MIKLSPKYFSVYLLLLIVGFLTGFVELKGQIIAQNDDYDREYITAFPNFITGRLYGSKKFTRLTLLDGNQNRALDFRPNIGLNFGIGATYSLFTLNIGAGSQWFGDPDKGDTDYLDLQSHLYSRKLIIDFFGQFYNSFYSNPRGDLYDTSGDFYVRSDLHMDVIGLSGFYLFNHREFSFRAALVQNERQKKSSGSALVGFEVYHIQWRADSSLIPPAESEAGFYSGRRVKRSIDFEIGPSAGYAHTFVYKEKWFATLSLTTHFSFEVITEYDDDGYLDRKNGFFPNLLSRAVVGYNSDQWFIGVSHINTYISANRESAQEGYLVQSGNFRINLARRIVPNDKARKYLELIEKGEEMITP